MGDKPKGREDSERERERRVLVVGLGLVSVSSDAGVSTKTVKLREDMVVDDITDGCQTKIIEEMKRMRR